MSVVKFTVCVTTFNRNESLKRTLDSILKQKCQAFEIIVVDDNSKIPSFDVIDLYQDDRITYIYNKENKGLPYNRNLAISKAKGEFFTFLDDDDTWEPDFLTCFEEYAEKYKEIGVFCSQKVEVPFKSFVSNLKHLMELGYTPPVGAQVYRTGILKESAYDNNIRTGVDHDLWFNLASRNYDLVWINQSLVVENVDSSMNRMTTNFDERINKVRDSIDIWKMKYNVGFDNDYWGKLEKNYRLRTGSKHIRRLMRERRYIDFIKLILKMPIQLMILDLIYKTLKNRLVFAKGYFHK